MNAVEQIRLGLVLVGVVMLVGGFFAVLRLFSIDKSLKDRHSDTT